MILKCGFAPAGLLLLSIFHPALAEPVHRCGSVYQDHPCPGATTIDAQPSTGMEVLSSSGAVVHSRDGDKARNARQMEIIIEIQRNGITCGLAGQAATAKNSRIECPAVKAQDDAKRLTPDYIRK